MNPNNLTVIVLTFNEELHLERCLRSILPLSKKLVVVDCYSTDRTVAIAKEFNATLLQKTWENNHSTQFNWALTQLPDDTDWVMRIDADEILTPKLIAQIHASLSQVDAQVNGIAFWRSMIFQGQLIRYGGVGKNRVMRLFRLGKGVSESRWMDEHIKVQGHTITLDGVLIDDNLRPLSWWIEKHNQYASREAVDLLNLQHQFAMQNSVASVGSRLGLKRWIKERIYAKLPGGSRALLYFLLRYIILWGFLDGKQGRQFHYLQAFWYRYLVDAKVAEVIRYQKKNHLTVQQAIEQVLGIKV